MRKILVFMFIHRKVRWNSCTKINKSYNNENSLGTSNRRKTWENEIKLWCRTST